MNKDLKEINKRFLEAMNRIITTQKLGVSTQKEFCRLMGMHEPDIGRIKRYGISPTLPHCIKLNTLFEVSMDWLICGKEI